jgi:hypothetical protein
MVRDPSDPGDPRDRALDRALSGLQRALDQAPEVDRLTSRLMGQASDNHFAEMVIDAMTPRGNR